MYVGADYSPAEQAEVEVYGLDFVNDLSVGDTLTNAAWTCAVASTSEATDPSPSSRIIGGPFVSSDTVTTVICSGFLPGVTYVMEAVVTTTQSRIVSLFSHVTGVHAG